MPSIRIGKPATQRIGRPKATKIIGGRKTTTAPRKPDVETAGKSGAISRCPTCVRIVG